jgi:hypothetical protein
MNKKILPYTIVPKYLPYDDSVQLSYREDGRFSIVKDGKFYSIIWATPGYFLLRSRLTRLLIEYNIPNFIFKSAYIYNPFTGQFWNDYFEVKIEKHIYPSHSPKVDKKGLRIWHYNYSHIFVSPKLKELIQKNGFSDLKFSYGYEGVRNIWVISYSK